MPPFSTPLEVSRNTSEKRNVVVEDFLASFMCLGNDFRHKHSTTFFSEPYVSPGGISITPENFEKAMIINMVRRLPESDVFKVDDQFTQPTKELSAEFISDAVIWSLFSQSNQTVSLSNVEYEGNIYRLKNNFYPWLLAEVAEWECSDPVIKKQIENETEDRFAALWIGKHFEDFSPEAWDVLATAQILYKEFYKNFNLLETKKYKISDWDAGWYQICMALGNKKILKTPFENLSAKLPKMLFYP